jgi:hypothetical protein
LSEVTTPATLWPLARQIKDGEGMPALAESLKEYPHRRFEGRMFVQDDLAGLLVWSLPGKAPVFVDSQVDVFPESHWQNYLSVLFGKAGWKAILDRNQINLIVVDPVNGRGLAEKLVDDPEWELIGSDGKSAKLLVAVRKHPLQATSAEVNP